VVDAVSFLVLVVVIAGFLPREELVLVFAVLFLDVFIRDCVPQLTKKLSAIKTKIFLNMYVRF
jgi:hypothetical protein